MARSIRLRSQGSWQGSERLRRVQHPDRRAVGVRCVHESIRSAVIFVRIDTTDQTRGPSAHTDCGTRAGMHHRGDGRGGGSETLIRVSRWARKRPANAGPSCATQKQEPNGTDSSTRQGPTRNQLISLYHKSTSCPESRKCVVVDPSEQTITTAVDGCADRIVTCGGTNPEGSHPRMTGRRSNRRQVALFPAANEHHRGALARRLGHAEFNVGHHESLESNPVAPRSVHLAQRRPCLLRTAPRHGATARPSLPRPCAA